MSNSESKQKLIEIVGKINELGVSDLGNFWIRDGQITEVFFVGGLDNLPQGDVKFESYEPARGNDYGFYPWKAVVNINGVRYTTLIDEDEAWKLYV